MTSVGGARRSVCDGPRLSLLLLVALLGWSVAAHGGIAIREPHELPVKLLQPVPGQVLEGGREATLTWRPLDGEMSGHVEEWEAFLSFDGGRHWPVRITPHLDIAVTSFRFTVPSIPSDDVRIMLRFGDEREEVGYVVPDSFRTVMSTGESVSTPSPSPVFERGEVARPGVPGVVLWVEGDRAGTHARLRSSAVIPDTLKRADTVRSDCSPAAIPPDQRTAEGLAETPRLIGAGATATCARLARRSSEPAQSLLPLLCRQNE